MSFFARAGYAMGAHLDPVQATTYIHAMQKNLAIQDYDMVRELHMMINHNQHMPKLMLARADMIMACAEDSRWEQYWTKASQTINEAFNRGETQEQSPELGRLKACLLALSRSLQEFQKQRRSERLQILEREMGREAFMTDAYVHQMNLDQLQTAFKKLRVVAHMLGTKLLHSREQVAGGTSSRDISISNGSGTQVAVNGPRANMMPNGGHDNRSIQVNNGNGTIGRATGPIPRGLPQSANPQDPQRPQVLDHQQAMSQAAATYQQQNNQGPQQGQQPAPMPNGLPKGGAHGGHIQMTDVKHTCAQAAGTVPNGLPNRGAQLSNVNGSNGGTTANGSPSRGVMISRILSRELALEKEQLEGMSSANLVDTAMKLQRGLMELLRSPSDR
ncbi:hypothetical protein HII31_07388 [Pseudocercospora fuligena]|uniref:Uncharacterized protein n=1 Tax=Pseudocercospora fuligena TaxID=685502 RepID=A0A8H6VH63_9PEZI|nr:hypothetical protein HII31_07388 [Pseudocercospora fuligena]